MKRILASESGLFTGRALLACLFCSIGASLAFLSFAGSRASPSISSVPPGFHAPVTMPGSSGGSEPSLAFTRNGTRFVSWQSPGEVATSADGVNFTQKTTPDSGATGDVTNAIGANDTLYLGQICGSATTLHTCIYRSTDGGTTWQQRNMLADNHPGASDRPWITVLPGADPDHDTVYLEFHAFSPDVLVYVTKSTDGGSTFGPPIPTETGTNAAIPSSGCNTIPGGIIVDHSNGDVYALWLSGDDVAQNITTGCNYTNAGPFPKAWVSRSTDGGTTFSPVLAWQGAFNLMTNIGDNAGKIFSTISQDKAGQIHIGLCVRHNDDPVGFLLACEQSSSCLESPNQTDMYIVTSPDQGAHWTLPFKVNQTVGSFFFPWIHAGSAGVVDVANYFSTTLRPNDPASIWYVGTAQVTGAVAHYVSGANATYDSTPVATPEIQLDSNRVHGNGTTGGGICTYGTACLAVPGSNRGLADVFEVHLDPAGGANIVWTSDNGGNHIGFACQNSGSSAIAGAPDLNGCYGPTDMSITKTASPDPVAPGGTLTYHLTVTNNGMPAMPATTSGVTLTDVLPAGVTFVSATPSSGSCSGTSTVTCNLGIFPSGATATVDIVVTVVTNASGTLTNTAAVAATTSDPDISNNTATATTTVSPVVPTSVVSRMFHGSITTPFDINLPLPVGTSPRGVECRSGASLGAGNYTLVFTFPKNLTSVASATVTGHDPTSATGTVSGPVVVGPNASLGLTAKQCAVNLTNVSNAQYITVRLNSVLLVTGTSGDVLSPQMGVLIGDVNASALVDSGDVFLVRQQTSQTAAAGNFRDDINATGLIDSGDVFLTRQHTSNSLPTPP
jgi:uncharacterized repeat protein (TIGR01451 family)